MLLTGGTGYIESCTFVALVAAGYTPVILDDFSNSQPAALETLERMTGQSVLCERSNVLDTSFVEKVLQRHDCTAVVHFPGFKAVSESVNEPLNYYSNNVGGLISLFQAMENADCKSIVFSSTATVYGDPVSVPVNEQSPCAPQSPYARTKLMGEHTLLGWRTSRTTDAMCRDAWRWQQSNPESCSAEPATIEVKTAQHGLENNTTGINETI